MKKQAFTLVEVMVVVIIIILLLTALIPALLAALYQAKDATCKARLKEWGATWTTFIEKNKNQFHDHTVSWPEALRTDYKEDQTKLQCPATHVDNSKPFGQWSETFDGITFNGSYSVNKWLCVGGGAKYWESSLQMIKPDKTPIMLDGCVMDVLPENSDSRPSSGNGGTGTDMTSICITRHLQDDDKWVNCLFANFSVREVKLKELWELKWHKTSDTKNPPNSWPNWMND